MSATCLPSTAQTVREIGMPPPAAAPIGAGRVCGHRPPCPPATATDHDAARLVAYHPEQGWGLLCNGVIVFDDTGELLPDESTITADNGTCRRARA